MKIDKDFKGLRNAGWRYEYGILKETGIEESDDKTEEAMKLLKEKGYKIIKE